MKHKIIQVLSILFGLLFLNAGLNKIFNYMPVPKDMPQEMLELMAAFKTIGWLLPLIAFTEMVGGILIMIPRFRALGAIVILPVIIGIGLTHLVNIPDGLILSLILMLFNFWIIIENRAKYLPMIHKSTESK